MTASVPPPKPAGLFRTLRSDVRQTLSDARRTGYRRTVSQTVGDLESYYLSDESRRALARMGRIRRTFVRSWWLFKALVLRLSPARRVLLAIGIAAIVVTFSTNPEGTQVHIEPPLLGLVCVLLVLALELREKLVAHDELAEGRAIQIALLPRGTPSIPGFDIWLDTVPANDVGGDIVDVLELDDGRFFVMLADVAGKGLGAALLAARLQATFRALAPDTPTLAAVGDRLNRIFHRDGPSNRFATFVCVAGRRGDRTLRLVNAGHLPPLLLRQGTMVSLPPTGPALGIIGSARFTDTEVTLEDGETLVVYSDGVTEAMNEEGELFGDQRLLSTLGAVSAARVEHLGPALQAAVRAFEGSAKPHDDLSLVVIRGRAAGIRDA